MSHLTTSLRKIESELRTIAAAADDLHPIDPFAVTVIARQIQAQIEMIDGGLTEPSQEMENENV